MIPTKHAAQIPHNNIGLSSLRFWFRFLFSGCFPLFWLQYINPWTTLEQQKSNKYQKNMFPPKTKETPSIGKRLNVTTSVLQQIWLLFKIIHIGNTWSRSHHCMWNDWSHVFDPPYHSYNSFGIGSADKHRSLSALSHIVFSVSVIFMQSHTYTIAFPSFEYATAPLYSSASL